MELMPIVIVITLILTLLLAIALFRFKRKRNVNNEKNYRTFFILGITFLPMGIVMSMAVDNPGFIGIAGMGAAFLVASLVNKDKWDLGE